MKKIQTGLQEFEKYYQTIYLKRWPNLFKSLTNPSVKFAFNPNDFSLKNKLNMEFINHQLIPKYLIQEWQKNHPMDYMLDPASYMAAISLPIENSDIVADLCAAPGGKSLVLWSQLKSNCQLYLNDSSLPRFYKLKNTIENFLSKDAIQQTINLTRKDVGQWGKKEQPLFNKILLDVPCSSEKHVLNMPQELKKWKPSRTKRLAQKQYNLLTSALHLLKNNGLLIYSTCSISPFENDQVIQKLLKKYSDQYHIKSIQCPIGQATQYGWEIFPDQTQFGPIYFSMIEKS